ncbi:toprim domain-containing protein [Alteromonas sp. RKMC-009]|uniref:toprim domain-containing protein n=1 Tax=Alteromonas sp. RKMC-009 TaxID=2267264 RepID=UPI000E67892D|nr:toprim domain-containing protein [Alteromonas sp. RKMC-009]AYA64175.1 topoisomerase [Alteromonas sp. RKMC-009]
MSVVSRERAAIEFGLQVSAILDDGALHRVPTKAKPKAQNGWYVSFGDVLVMGDWQTGLTATWKGEGNQLTKAEQRRIRQAIDNAKRTKSQQRKSTALRAVQMFNAGVRFTAHPYLTNKGIENAEGLRVQGQWLLIPLFDVASGNLVNLQRISPDGQKLFLKGGQITGTACFIGVDDGLSYSETFFICEGYATGSTLHKITSQPVLAAMNAGNLLPVSIAAKRKWPVSEFVIAGDDDYLTFTKHGTNPGQEKAAAAAVAINAKVSYPPFTLEQKKRGMTDWNDYYLNSLKEGASA